MPYAHTLVLTLAVASGSAHAMTDATLADTVARRLQGDRTGACMAVAVVENGSVARTFQCADPKDAARIGPDTAFEIGSVSKTMTAALLADLIGQGKGSLDDPLSAWLPPGTTLPDYQGKPILLRHIVTHTSGLPALPSRMGAPDMTDPYAKLDEAALLASLGDVTLAAAPGTKFEYSNFASMVLSYAVARRAGTDIETLMKQRLFAPLGMRHAYINAAPAGVRAAVGHTPNARSTPAWRFQTNLAGVGGVRATLDDMVRYVQGELGTETTSISPALQRSQQKVSDAPPMAMNWMLMPVGGRTVHVHEGGTGGFSSFVSFDREKRRGVVILSDTTWNSIGSLGSLGLHLVDASFPLGEPRREVAADAALIDTLAGEYQLASGMKMILRRKGDALEIQPAGQGTYLMGHDSAGDFYPRDFDAVLRPQRGANGQAFTWLQMGGAIPAVRIDKAAAKPAFAVDAATLRDYEGEYPLVPGFGLSVKTQGDALTIQGTGQPALPVQAVERDVFVMDAVGAEIRFERDAAGNVVALTLKQAGQRLRGEKQ
ncbi:CubicO group peptidase (beta-lactamase class C family) [Pseudoxanthomonas japonensis]|uniref:serine hydrolase n=1 Tax=Pseudoxanthomonas TaxID=83618 RepID=UPI0007837478|nr:MULTISPECIES: serine hydrolase [Pseudoxanthomonas]MDR7069283.1 CubicO group peptidase (beta-lactamase class C family) [Pseudoxanthomonas japonensis]